ncbi:MAG: hypothetical protein ACR2G6_01615 [Gemmatimonadaceae bacterium]
MRTVSPVVARERQPTFYNPAAAGVLPIRQVYMPVDVSGAIVRQP